MALAACRTCPGQLPTGQEEQCAKDQLVHGVSSAERQAQSGLGDGPCCRGCGAPLNPTLPPGLPTSTGAAHPSSTLSPPQTPRIWGCGTFAHPGLYHETCPTSHWYWGCLRWSTKTFPSTDKGPNLPSCSAGCKSNTGDANQSTGKGWEPGRPPPSRAQLNPLLVLPSQQRHPRGLFLPRSPATATPLGDRGTECGAGGAICVPTESRGSYSPPLSPCPHRSPYCSQHCGLCPCPLRTGSVRMEGGGSGVTKAVTTPSPAPHGCPWQTSQLLLMSQRAPLLAPSFSPFNDTRLGQRLTISCCSISGSGGGGREGSLDKKEANPSPAPSVATSSLLRAVGAPGKRPPCSSQGAPAACGGLQVTQQHVPPAPAPQQRRDNTSCARRAWTRAVSSHPPAGVLDRVNTAASSVLASSRAAPPRVG